MVTAARIHGLMAPGVRHGPSDMRYVPPHIETARIVNVNINDWSVDAISEVGNKRFFDIQVSSPYLHYANGEGIYVMPEVGAFCWICRPSTGSFSTPFIMGFQSPVDFRKDDSGKQADNFRANRQSLNPGDMMFRTRDENFIILRRGGVIQIGSTPIAQRMYIPVRNFIKDFCENYQLTSLAGEMAWSVDRTDQTTDGTALTQFSLKAKNHADEPGAAAIITMGSHKDNDKLTLHMLVNDSGSSSPSTMVELQVTKDGNVQWDLQKDWILNAKGNIALSAAEQNLTLQALKGEALLHAAKNLSLESANAQIILSAAKEVVIGAASLNVGCPSNFNDKVALGQGASEPVVLGNRLVAFLSKLITICNNPDPATGAGITTGPGDPILLPGLNQLLGDLETLVSTNTTTA